MECWSTAPSPNCIRRGGLGMLQREPLWRVPDSLTVFAVQHECYRDHLPNRRLPRITQRDACTHRRTKAAPIQIPFPVPGLQT